MAYGRGHQKRVMMEPYKCPHCPYWHVTKGHRTQSGHIRGRKAA